MSSDQTGMMAAADPVRAIVTGKPDPGVTALTDTLDKAGLTLTTDDQAVAAWLSGADPQVLAVIAGWVERASAASRDALALSAAARAQRNAKRRTRTRLRHHTAPRPPACGSAPVAGGCSRRPGCIPSIASRREHTTTPRSHAGGGGEPLARAAAGSGIRRHASAYRFWHFSGARK